MTSEPRLAVARPLAVLGVGFVALAVGRVGIACLIVVATVVRAQLPVLAPRLAGRTMRAEAHLVHGIATSLAWLIIVPVHLVLVVPLWLVSSLTPWSPLDRSTTSSAAWSSAAQAGARPQAPFGEAHPGARTRRPGLALSIVACTALAAALIGVGWRVSSGPQGSATPTGLAPALRAQPDAEQMIAEEAAVLDRMSSSPTLGWTLPESAPGSLVGVAEGRRVTDPSGPVGPLVWFFGGSTMFGSGQRDAHTIPSVVAQLAEDAGVPIRTENFGVHAYTSAQEVDSLELALQDAEEIPDLVVFYDGFNDVEVGMAGALLGVAPGVPARAVPPLPGVEGEDLPPPVPFASADERYDGIVTARSAAMDGARQLGRARGFDVVDVWQPNAYTRPLTASEERTLDDLGIDDLQRAVYSRIHEEVRRRLPSDVIDLADALDGAPTVYYDTVHTNEEGARIVAEAMFRELRDDLDRPSLGGRPG